MDERTAIKEIRAFDCREHCEGIADAIPHSGCFTCRAGAAIEALSISAYEAICISKGMMKPMDAITEIKQEECIDICGKKGLSIPNDNCSSCRWGIAINALMHLLHEQTCSVVGIDMLGRELRINDEVNFVIDGTSQTGFIQSATKAGMLRINSLSGVYRRSSGSVTKIITD